MQKESACRHLLVEVPGQEEVFVSDWRRQHGVGGASSLSSEINALIRCSSRWEVRLLIDSKATNYGGIRGKGLSADRGLEDGDRHRLRGLGPKSSKGRDGNRGQGRALLARRRGKGVGSMCALGGRLDGLHILVLSPRDRHGVHK